MIKVSLIVLFGLAATLLMRKQSASLRHWILASALVCAAAVPMLERVVPAWNLPITASWLPASRNNVSFVDRATVDETSATTSGEQAAGARQPAASAVVSLEMIWMIGAAISFALLAVGLGRMAWIASRSRVVSTGPWFDTVVEISGDPSRTSPVRLLQSDHANILVTWGFNSPTVVLPVVAKEWPSDRIRAVLGHELAHVQRRDWAIQMVAEVLRCIYWFNPLVWIACHRLRQASEQACDDAVINMGVAAPEYAAHLLDVARAFRHTTRRSLFPVMAMIRPSQLERRVRAMLNQGINRSPLTRFAGAATLLGLLILTVPIAGIASVSQAAPAIIVQPSSNAASPAATSDRLLPVETASLAPPARPAITPAAAAPSAGVVVPSTAGQATPGVPVKGTASISGTVIDATGRPMPGVAVAIVNLATKVESQMKTGDTGQFAANGLAAAEYQLDVSKPGFMRTKLAVSLADGQAFDRTIYPQIGMLAEMVSVSAGAGTPVSGSPAPPIAAVVVLRDGVVRTAGDDPCENAPAGGCITPPRKLMDSRPLYPQAHAANGVSGKVVINARIGTDGSLTDLRPNEAADSAFASAAVDAVRLWKFSPVKLNGIPQECRIEVTVQFTADKR